MKDDKNVVAIHKLLQGELSARQFQELHSLMTADLNNKYFSKKPFYAEDEK